MSGNADQDAARPARPSRRKLMLYAPLAVAGVGGLGFWAMLRGLGDGSFNPRGVPSALIGKTAPEFSLPGVEGLDLPPLSSPDLLTFDRPIVVNFWASWCVPCIVEHPQLMALHRQGVPVLGINYKDRAPDARNFLTRHGNPFTRLGADFPGRTAIDWGVYGVPESYVLDRRGVIRWRWAGPITPEVMSESIVPLIRSLGRA
ncbi:DsbE family thiol:disulfide interchange protein [Roseococcus pinisoli]|uniref:DsbE family thiol:disulfide interchange protein n=1 Tax=Roseococcus pinisoli TaxID=2835040 RepID=A0ABS5Q8C9_9PROT|nr:DsbE family thiol:disulfide interchange protein [Roseococcus pinisoli]MBS7809890.1 DsbE family thiol:disulfide interchange protein [Roseococcus pinisoli]